MNPLGIGIIGAGGIGARQARFWSLLPEATVIAIADQNPDAAERLAQSLSGATAHPATELLARPDIDAVHVCVPTDRHIEVVLAAIAAGKHVLCEKPMALTLADCDAMIAAATQADVRLSVGQVVRFFPEYAQAKQLVDAGSVGTPTVVRTRRAGGYPRTAWFADTAQSGGVIADLVVHDLDWLQWCFGPIVRAYARVARAEKFEYALLTLRHQSGTISHAEGVWGEPSGFHATFEIAGDAGLLTHDSRAARSLVTTARPGMEGVPMLPTGPLALADDPYYRQVQAFAAALQGDVPVAVSPADARAAVAVALAALESARTNRAIEVEVARA